MGNTVLKSQVQNKAPLHHEEERSDKRSFSLDRLIGDRVYEFPDGLPAEAIDLFIEMLTEEKMSDKELDYLYFILITLPQMADKASSSEEFAEQTLSFKDYVHFQMKRMKRLVDKGLDAKFCYRIRQHLGRFANIERTETI